MKNNKINLFLEIPYIQDSIFVLVSQEVTFHEILVHLYDLCPNLSFYYAINESTEIYEKETMLAVDPSKTLKELNVSNHQFFILF